MKHNFKITSILLAMFFLTQFIGLVVLYVDPLNIETEINGTIEEIPNPYLNWINSPKAETQSEFFSFLSQLIFSFILAIGLLFVLMKFKIEIILKIWFFVVVSIALFLSFLAFEKLVPFSIKLELALGIAGVLAIVLAYFKIYKKGFLLHNLTEFLIYPGIAVVFIPILNIYTIIVLLILISIYDMWAVWHSGIMQKMANYQINKLNVFSGFFVPYVSKKLRMKIKKMKKSELKKKKIKVNVAILGGGDVVFPIITAGIMFKSFGIFSALLVIAGATLGLGCLFFFSEKKKFYPAMPFITAGIFIGMALSWIFL